MNGYVAKDRLPKYMYPSKPINEKIYDVLTDDYNAARIAENFPKCVNHT